VVPAYLHLSLSTTQGAAGTKFTATATVSRALACDQFRTAVAEGDDISFDWRFDHQTQVTDANHSASATFTVPEDAKPDAYRVTASCAYSADVTDSATFTVTENPA
jgi:hypothetical protein